MPVNGITYSSPAQDTKDKYSVQHEYDRNGYKPHALERDRYKVKPVEYEKDRGEEAVKSYTPTSSAIHSGEFEGERTLFLYFVTHFRNFTGNRK